MDDELHNCDGFEADGTTAAQKQGWAGDIVDYFDKSKVTTISHGHNGATMQMLMEGRTINGHTCSWNSIKTGIEANDYVVLALCGNDENRLTGASFDDVVKSNGQVTEIKTTKTSGYWLRKYYGADGVIDTVVEHNNKTYDDRQFSSEQLTGWYREVIDDCLAKDAKVLLLTRPPKTNDLVNGKFGRASAPNVDAVIDTIREEYGSNSNVEYIDMSQYYADSLNELIESGETGESMLATKIPEGQTSAGKYITGSIFVDYSHLTARGAALFANTLADKISNLPDSFGLAGYLKQKEKTNIVLLGDSLVDDVDHTSSGTVQKEGWEGDIGTYFNEDVAIIPHGHGGATIQMLTEGRKTSTHYCGWSSGDTVISSQVGDGDYVVISLGTNDQQRITGGKFDDNDGAITVSDPTKSLYARMDSNYQFTAEQFKKMYSDIIGYATAKGAKVLILSPPPVSDSVVNDKFDSTRCLAEIRTAITELKNSYSDNKNVAYIDMAEKYSIALNELVDSGVDVSSMVATEKNSEYKLISGSIFVDWCHFSAEGAALYAQVLSDEIAKLPDSFGLARYLK